MNLRPLRTLTPRLVAPALAIVFGLAVVASQPAQAQTFRVLHAFTGGNDGGNPSAGVTLKAGYLYGTTYAGGDLACNPPHGCGTAYQLKHGGAGWTFSNLYTFTGSDGAIPTAPVVFGPDGALYSTTEFGGYDGNVFKLRPGQQPRPHSARARESVLHTFAGGTNDGSKPIGVVFDQAGNIYGTTSSGGAYGDGTVYKLTASGNGWTESVLHSFGLFLDGQVPYRSVPVLDNAGNLYGTTYYGGTGGWGTVFQVTPTDTGWKENVIYNFQGGADGRYPYTGLILDEAGNLYGTTSDAGTGGGGTVFELSPSGSGWTFSLLHGITGTVGNSCGPQLALIMDAAGNLYGTTGCDGAHSAGNVFKLTNTGSSWTYTSLHDFTAGSDGALPISSVALDANGNLYGTTYYGGSGCSAKYGCGVIWEITP